MDRRKCPCGKTASFAAPGSTKRTHCASCKTADMVSMVIKKKARATAARVPGQEAEADDEDGDKYNVFSVTVSRRSKGQSLGVALTALADMNAFGIDEVLDAGLLCEWNEANPDEQIMAGDIILTINGAMEERNNARLARSWFRECGNSL